MSYLLDTCVISELSRPRPDPGVVAWMSEADVASLHLSAITIGEVRRGMLRLPAGKRRMIAATALDRGLTLVTRNVTDFEPFGVSLLNPWAAA